MGIREIRKSFGKIKATFRNLKSKTNDFVETLNPFTTLERPALQKIPAKPRPKSQLHRMAERGNVFFTLFGAVAVVGVLGAGVMSTMRGPLSTMVEVNRREQAKAEVRLATGLVLVNASDGCGDGDGYTEGDAPTGSGPTGGGTLPSVGAPQSDPWGTPYGYCAWDHGPDAATMDGCGTILAGNTSSNNIAVAIISAGPDRVFQTSCVADNSGTNDYIEPDGGGGDDIVVTQTYNEAVAGSGGLWDAVGADTASIDRDLDVTGGASFSGDVNLSSGSGALRLGAASLFLPDHTTLTDCNDANNGILRINNSTSTPALEVCDGTGGASGNWLSAGSVWSAGTGDDIYYDTGAAQVGIGTNSPDDVLDVVGSAQITGAVALDSTVTIGDLATLESLTVTNESTFNGSVTFNQPLAGDLVITGSTSDNSADALDVRNSGATSIFTVQNDGKVGINNASPSFDLDVGGDINTTGTYLIDGDTVLASDNNVPSTIVLGRNAAATLDMTTGGGVANNNTILGANAAVSLTTGTDNIVIGQGVDIANANNQLNIGDAITGDLSSGNITVAGDLTVSGDNIALGTNTDGNILVNDGTSFGSVALSGDATIVNSGALTIADDAITEDKILNAAVTSTKIATTTTPADNQCLKYIGTQMKWEDCSGSGGGDGLGGEGLDDVLTNGDDGGGLNIVNVGGIGIGTDNPTHSLHITNGDIHIANASNGTGGTYALIRRDGGLRLVRPTDAGSGIVSGYIDFDTDDNALNGYARFYYNSTNQNFHIVSYNGLANPGLTVASGIKVGNDTNTCDASKAGTIRYNSGELQYCNSSSWVSTGGGGGGSGSGGGGFAFVLFNGSTGVIIDAQGVDSVTRNSIGSYTVNFASGTFTDGNYAYAGSGEDTDARGDVQLGRPNGGTKTASTFDVNVMNANAALVDFPEVAIIFTDGSGGGSGSDTLAGLSCTDGQVAAWDNAGSAWVCADQTGGGTSTDVSFYVHKNGTNQTVTASTLTNMTWPTEVFDTNDNFASDRFTPTVAGKYIITGGVGCVSATNGCNANIYKNGTRLHAGSISSGNSGTANFSTVSAIVDMNGTDDYVELWGFNGGGATINGGVHVTYFTGALVGGGGGGSDTLAGLSCTDGQVAAWDNSGSAWVCADQTGGGGGGGQDVSFSVHKNGTGQFLGSTAKLTWSTEDFDTNDDFDTATGRYTPTVAGKYLIVLNVDCQNCSLLHIYKNGSSYISNAKSVSALIDMNGTTDYVEAYSQVVSTTASVNGDASKTRFSGFLISGGTGSDTLAGLSCTDGQVAAWDDDGSAWVCADGGVGGGGAGGQICIPDPTNTDFLPTFTANTTDSFIASATSTGSGHNPWNAFDNSTGVNNKWLTDSVTVATLTVQLPTAMAVNTYNLQIPNESSYLNRAPKTWTFEGSNNGSDWTVLDTQASQTSWSNQEERGFETSNETQYTYYKWSFTASNGSTYIAVGDIDLIGPDCYDVLGGGSDTLSGLSCTDGQVAAWDNTGSAWVCANDQTGSGGGGGGPASCSPAEEGAISNANLNGADGVFVSGNYAYVTSYDADSLTVVDVSTPASPSQVGTISNANLNGAIMSKVVGNYAYVVSFDADSLTVIDISNPASPSQTGVISNASLNGAEGVDVVGNYAYVSSYNADSLTVIDISNPASPSQVGTISNTNLNGAQGVKVSGNYAYVISELADSLTVIDISNPASPSQVGTISNANLNGAEGLDVEGSYAYVTAYDASALTIIDVSTPASPSQVGTISNASINGTSGVDVVGDYAYVGGYDADSLTIIDVSDPASPSELATISNANLNAVERLHVVNGLVYVTAYNSDSLTIIDPACSGGSGGGGGSDNLGDHTATQDLDMDSNDILNINAANFDAIAGDAPISTSDTLGGLSCTDGQVAAWNNAGSVWECADQSGGSSDNLGDHTATQDLDMDSNDILNINAANFDAIAGDAPVFTDDTLSGLSCTDGQVAAWNNAGSIWECADAASSDTLSSLSCTDGQVAAWNNAGSAWECANQSGGADNLGDHTATQDIDAASNNILNVNILEFDALAGDAPSTAASGADNLGNHTATTNIDANSNSVINVNSMNLVGVAGDAPTK